MFDPLTLLRAEYRNQLDWHAEHKHGIPVSGEHLFLCFAANVLDLFVEHPMLQGVQVTVISKVEVVPTEEEQRVVITRHSKAVGIGADALATDEDKAALVVTLPTWRIASGSFSIERSDPLIQQGLSVLESRDALVPVLLALALKADACFKPLVIWHM